ncbi:hypothetical protein MMA231_00951 [Asticcacaulis sp. MM231]|uniref:hypothetical protein n=1 Tax=Asticcacaulis sp. MM231 TaxID=3157666 RepID=UPI0032D59CB8
MGDISMQHIAAAIGTDAARKFEEVLGGRRFVIPQKIGIHHPIGDVIGIEAGEVLSAALAGSIIDVPVTARKRALVERALSEGKSVNTIARTYLCTPRYVQKIKATRSAVEAEAKQGKLF